MGGVAVILTIAALVFGCIFAISWGLASTHPTPSQTALIPTAMISAIVGLACLVLALMAALIWIVIG